MHNLQIEKNSIKLRKYITYSGFFLCVVFCFFFCFFAFCLFRFTFNSDNQYFPVSYTDIGKLIESRVSEIFEGRHGKEIISLSIYQNDLMMSNVDGIFSFHISWLTTRYYIHLPRCMYVKKNLNVKGQKMRASY